MTLQTIIQDLKKTEERAVQKVVRANETAAANIDKTVKQAETDFNKLRITLEKGREQRLGRAEKQVAKETEKITTQGEEERKRLNTSAQKQQKAIKDAITTTILP